MAKIVHHATRTESERLFSSLNMKFAVYVRSEAGAAQLDGNHFEKKKCILEKNV